MRWPIGISMSERRVPPATCTPIAGSGSRMPALSVDWVPKQAAAARP
jgi:hypothetical protein